MNDTSVTLTDVMAAAAAQRASLVPETAGYLVLAVADAIARSPLLIDDRSVRLTGDGDVELNLQGELGPSPRSLRWIRDLLARLLSVSAGAHSGLRAAAEPPPEGEEPLAAFVLRVESALIPMNRAAGRRALARLARETSRARSLGLLAASAAEAPSRPAPSALAAPPPPPSPAHAAAPEPRPEPAAVPPAPSLPRPASPGERRLEALHATRARVGLLNAPTWVGVTRWPEPMLGTRRRSPIAFYDWDLPEAPSAASAPSSEAEEPAASPPTAPFIAGRSDELSLSPPAIAPSPPGDSISASPEPSVPLWVEVSQGEPEHARSDERRGVTMRFMFAADGAVDPLDERALHAASAELIGFIERTPSAPIDLPGSPTIAMKIEPYELFSIEPPHVGQTLPWPASYPYDRLALSEIPRIEPDAAPAALEHESASECEHAEGAPLEVIDSAPIVITGSAPIVTSDDAPEPLELESAPREPSEPAPAAAAEAPAPPDAPPAGPDRADELLQRFGTSSAGAGETNMKAAAKGLRALAGIDLTPSMSAMPPAITSSSSSADTSDPRAMDDITPPATSPGPSSTRPPRAQKRGLARNVAAFAVGLAGATILVHVKPSFPEDVVELVAHAIPDADPPSPSGRSPSDLGEEPRAVDRPSAAPAEPLSTPPAHEPPASDLPARKAEAPIDD